MSMEVAQCNILLKFLEHAKEETYGPIETSSLPYARIKEETIEVLEDDTYYYSVS